jgi:hypothetical protein
MDYARHQSDPGVDLQEAAALVFIGLSSIYLTALIDSPAAERSRFADACLRFLEMLRVMVLVTRAGRSGGSDSVASAMDQRS